MLFCSVVFVCCFFIAVKHNFSGINIKKSELIIH